VDATGESELILRNRVIVITGWVSIGGIILGLPLVILWVCDWTWPTDLENGQFVLLAVVLGVAVLWFVTVRPRVIADTVGVRVVDPLVRSRRLAWSDIESVTVETALYEGVALNTVDGERVMPYALQSGFAFGLSSPGHRWASDLASQLESLRTGRG
jgi:hypothetical protein